MAATLQAVAGRRWCRRAPDLRWGDSSVDGVVFDPDTGETHFLSELPRLLLTVVTSAPVSHAELVERLAGQAELDSQAEAQVITALVFLERAELIESRDHTME